MAAQAICAPACINSHPASRTVEIKEIIGSKTVTMVFQVSCQDVECPQIELFQQYPSTIH